MSDISKIDKNFAVTTNIERKNIKFYSVDEKPFRLYGVFREDEGYVRMPEQVAESVSEQVKSLNLCTAGGRVRFVTDSPYVAIYAKMRHVIRMSHFALTGVAGLDMYDGNSFVKCFIPPFDFTDSYSGVYDFSDRKMRSITIDLPLYSGVLELYIGLDADSIVAPAEDYVNKLPVVYYGSSITQGGCASRPGNSYQAIVSRRLDLDYINLGFSGSAKAEENMMNYIASLGMSVFVYDYDHNAPTLDHLSSTHYKGYKTVRSAHPTLPIIMMTRPNAKINYENDERYRIIRSTYEKALAEGDKNVYFIGAEELCVLCGSDGTVDGVHPTDFGFASIAKAVSNSLSEILNDN